MQLHLTYLDQPGQYQYIQQNQSLIGSQNNHWFNPQFLPSADLSISSSSSSLSCTSSNLSISPSDCPKWVSSSSSNLYFPCRSWWCYVIILHLSHFMFFNYFHESQTNVLLRKVCVINSMNIVVLYLLYMYIAVICWNVAHTVFTRR